MWITRSTLQLQPGTRRTRQRIGLNRGQPLPPPRFQRRRLPHPLITELPEARAFRPATRRLLDTAHLPGTVRPRGTVRLPDKARHRATGGTAGLRRGRLGVGIEAPTGFWRSATVAWIVAGVLALAVAGLSVALASQSPTAARILTPSGRSVPNPGKSFGGPGFFGGGAGSLGVVGTVASVTNGHFTVTDRVRCDGHRRRAVLDHLLQRSDECLVERSGDRSPGGSAGLEKRDHGDGHACDRVTGRGLRTWGGELEQERAG